MVFCFFYGEVNYLVGFVIDIIDVVVYVLKIVGQVFGVMFDFFYVGWFYV